MTQPHLPTSTAASLSDPGAARGGKSQHPLSIRIYPACAQGMLGASALTSQAWSPPVSSPRGSCRLAKAGLGEPGASKVNCLKCEQLMTLGGSSFQTSNWQGMKRLPLRSGAGENANRPAQTLGRGVPWGPSSRQHDVLFKAIKNVRPVWLSG